jgi:molybdopterin synthase catalytic subunit
MMESFFLLQDFPLVPALLSKGLEHPSAGAFVSFEGRVRDRASAGSVLHLEYQAHGDLCAKVGTEIVFSSIGRFGLRAAIALHRTGILVPGDSAIWIGVLAGHRQEAFPACAWILETIKHELPVWKKEVLADGTGTWIH